MVEKVPQFGGEGLARSVDFGTGGLSEGGAVCVGEFGDLDALGAERGAANVVVFFGKAALRGGGGVDGPAEGGVVFEARLRQTLCVEQDQRDPQQMPGQQDMAVGFMDAEIERVGERVFLRIDTAGFHRVGQVAHIDGLRREAQCPEHALMVFIGERPELQPSQAMAMFWWADGPTRRAILQRHAADRGEMIARCAEILPMMAAEGWQDDVARKGLQMIERRQRNREAIEKSEFESLEDAISQAAVVGMAPEIATEIGYLAGVKPVTIAKILSDRGGEGLAVLCKATGLKRPYLKEIWRALKRPLEIDEGVINPQFAYVSESYELLSVAKAQTTLRYWNWSLSSSFSQEIISGDMMKGEFANDEDQFSASQRTAKLVFS